MEPDAAVLVHLGAGIGNVVLATPLLVALSELGFTVDVLLAADYAETAELLRPWSVVRQVFSSSAECSPQEYRQVVPALPPFYAGRFGRGLARLPNALPRPPDGLFYADEQAFYRWFLRALGGADLTPGVPCLPITAPVDAGEVSRRTLVLAPGCKTGEMAAKRWPHFAALAAEFTDVALVGTADDLFGGDGTPFVFPSHVRLLAGRFSLRETAELLAAAGTVVGNDSGLTHIAAAVGTPTVMLFGPTPDATLGPLPPNVRVVRRGLGCEPCWFRERFRACHRRIECLNDLPPQVVAAEVRALGAI